MDYDLTVKNSALHPAHCIHWRVEIRAGYRPNERRPVYIPLVLTSLDPLHLKENTDQLSTLGRFEVLSTGEIASQGSVLGPFLYLLEI